MLLPLHAALGALAAVVITASARAVAVTVASRRSEFRTIASAFALVILLPAWPAELRSSLFALSFEFRPVLARARKARAVVAIVTRPVVAAAAIVTLPPRFFIAPIATSELAVITTTLEWAILAAAFELTIAVAIPELAILKTPGRTRFVPVAARRPSTARAVIAAEPGFVAAAVLARLERAPLAVAVARGTIAERPIAARAVIAAEPGFVAAAFVVELFGPKTALGELLFGSPRLAGTALALRPLTPAARGMIVFVGVAGHEGARFG
jgi:hypothetical protein